jgi:hypothetical protein
MCKYNNRRVTSVTLPLASIENRQKEGGEGKDYRCHEDLENFGGKQLFARLTAHNWIMKSRWLGTTVWAQCTSSPAHKMHTLDNKHPSWAASMGHFQLYCCCDCVRSAPAELSRLVNKRTAACDALLIASPCRNGGASRPVWLHVSEAFLSALECIRWALREIKEGLEAPFLKRAGLEVLEHYVGLESHFLERAGLEFHFLNIMWD